MPIIKHCDTCGGNMPTDPDYIGLPAKGHGEINISTYGTYDHGFVAQVRNALRAKDSDGLPQAVSVGGEYVQSALLTFEQYRAVVSQYLKRGYANLDRAKRFDARCVAAHGVSVMPTRKGRAA
jgi:hypothetical protein